MPTPPPIDRRRLLVGSLGAAGALATGHGSAATPTPLLVENVTRLYPVEVARIEVVHSAADVAAAITRWPGQVAVGGGRYSMGGQIGVKGGLHIDMRAMNQLVWVRPADRAVRVQAGMRWRDLQDVLDPLGLA
uniref:FAD-binding protein n=1 Tax=uncultured Aquincola sp. TaxID=886556 RepID=UPI0032B21525